MSTAATSRFQVFAAWVSISSAARPSPAAAEKLAAIITRCGRNRSASTPPTSVNTSIGASCAASTKDTAAASPSGCAADLVTASTAKDSATEEMPVADVDSRRSSSTSRNWLIRRTVRDSRKVSFRDGASATWLIEGASAAKSWAGLLTVIYLFPTRR